MKPFVNNAANQDQIKNAEIKSKLNQDQVDADLRFLLSTDQGRRYIWRVLEVCGIYKSSFTGSSETFFLEGQRNVGLKLLSDIMRVDPDSYIKMYKQSRKD